MSVKRIDIDWQHHDLIECDEGPFVESETFDAKSRECERLANALKRIAFYQYDITSPPMQSIAERLRKIAADALAEPKA